MQKLINVKLINANETPKMLCFAELINVNGGLDYFFCYEKNKEREKMLLSYKNFKEEQIKC